MLCDVDQAPVAMVFQRCDEMLTDSGVPAAAADLVELVLDLGACFALHCRIFLESGKIAHIDDSPALLCIGVRLVEVLDVLVAPEETCHTIESCATERRTQNTAMQVVPVALFRSGGFVSTSIDIINGKYRRRLEDIGADVLADELEFHAVLIVRLVLSWDPPLDAAHPATMFLAINGHHVLSSYGTSLTISGLSVKGGSPVVANFGMLAVVLDALHLSLRKSSVSKLDLLKGRGFRGDPARRGNCPLEGIAPIIPFALEVLRRVAIESSQKGNNNRNFHAAAALDAAVAAAIALLAVMGLPSASQIGGGDVPLQVAQTLGRLLERQPPTVRLLQALRHIVARSSQPVPWLPGSGNQQHRKLCQALAAEQVIPLCIDGCHRLLAGHDELDSSEQGDPNCLIACVRSATHGTLRMITMFEHLEAIVDEVSGAGGAAQLDKLRSLREQCGGSEESRRIRPPFLQNLEHLRRAIRETCIAPRWRV